MPLSVFNNSTNSIAAPMAPAVSMLDLRAVSDLQNDDYSANWGDGSESNLIDPRNSIDAVAYPTKARSSNTDCGGPIAAHWFLNPRAYTATATAGGKKYAWGVNVQKDTRRQAYFSPNGNDANLGTTADKPLKSTDLLAKLMSAGNVRCYLSRGQWTMPGTVNPGPNVVVQGANPAIAIITPAPGDPFVAGAGNGSTTDFVCMSVGFNSPLAAGSKIATVKGTNWSFLSCNIGTIARGFDVEGCNGLFMHNVQQLGMSDVGSQVVYIADASLVVVQFCSFLRSDGESPFRITGTGSGTGGVNGLSAIWNLFAEPGQAKAAMTDRAGQDHYFANNAIVNADFSVNVGIGNPGETLGETRVKKICVRDSLLKTTGNPATFRISPGVIGATYKNLDFRGTGKQPAVTITPNWSDKTTLDGIVLHGSTIKASTGVPYLLQGQPQVATPAAQATPGATAWPGLTVV